MRNFLILSVAAVAAVAVMGTVSALAVTSKPTVAVQLLDFSVLPATQAAPAGKVRFVVTNAGTVKHEFVVVKTSKPAGSLLKGREADETGAAGEIGDIAPGKTKMLTLTLKRGHYSLICNLPRHYLLGQFADFYVR